MKVKCFDAEHERDLERQINEFLKDDTIKIDHVSYSVSHFPFKEEQIFSFSAIIFYSKMELEKIQSTN